MRGIDEAVLRVIQSLRRQLHLDTRSLLKLKALLRLLALADELMADAPVKIDRKPAFSPQFLHKRRVHSHTLDAQIEPHRRPVELPARRQHSRAGRAGFASKTSGVEHGNTHARLRETPGDGRA